MRLVYVVLVAALAALAPTADLSAQCPPYDRAPFDLALSSAAGQMNQMEQLVADVERNKVLSDGAGDAFDAAVQGYANNIFTAYQIAYEAANQAGNTNGEQGDGRLLAEVEAVVGRDGVRATGLAQRWEEIYASINQNEITGGPGAKAASAAPSAAEQQMMMHAMVRPGFRAILAQGQRPVGPLAKAYDSVMDTLFPEVHAAQIAKCIPPCAAKNWSACVACIVQGGMAVINAWNHFVDEWNAAGPCKWYRPWACARKAWALVKFLAVVA